ncbi:hemolysin family protein [Thermicanus aegyptius]|uniref:hemolysin family protein n=1 Tax=Thermicanus aegyptius TaxID=94009 RepID=UPI00041BCB7A|nr:hemolysin family protein [Thermicanus aegyptius]
MIGFSALIILFLLLATAFFVAVEFAVVRVRPSRIEQLVMEGDRRAFNVQRVIHNLDNTLSAAQLGITITTVGLGWMGEPAVEHIFHPLFSYFPISEQAVTVASVLFSFILITLLEVVLGELVPKTYAIQKAEEFSLSVAGVIIWFYRLMFPLVWVLNSLATLISRLIGLKPVKELEESHSEEELKIILSESYESGEINQSEYGYVNRIFNFDDRLSREIMVPRTDMVCLYLDKSLKENLKIIKEERYTRFPVAVGDKDHIVGMINTKEFFLRYMDDPNLDFSKLVRPVLTVMEATPIKDLLKEMQKKRVHFAVLVDEYGGTAGLVTIEDILEEIVGDIRDEFDEEEVAEIQTLAEGHLLVDGKTLLEEINERFHTHIESEDYDTVGGWLYGENPILREGSEVEREGLLFRIKEMERHRVRKVEIIRQSPHEMSEEEKEKEEQN